MARLVIEIGDEILPAEYVVCPFCNGHGSHSKHLGSFTWDDEYMRDEHFRENYFAGNYDRVCEECGGIRVVKEVNWKALTSEQAEMVERYYRQEAEYRAMVAAERRAGC